MPEIDISNLAALDERDTPAPRVAAAAFAPAFEPPPPPPLAPRFAPPTEDDDVSLGVERSTRAIRIANHLEREAAARQLGVAPAGPPIARPGPLASRASGSAVARASGASTSGASISPARRSAGLLIAILAIVAVAATVFVLVRHQPAPAAPHAGISIRITAAAPTAFTIDGHPAGNTPVTLQRSRGTQPIVIATPTITKQVIPDHDQVVDLSSP